jgi:hypothetical protein
MRTYFKVTTAYLLLAVLVMFLLHGTTVETVLMPVRVADLYAGLFLGSAVYFLPLVLPLMWWFGRRSSLEHLSLVFLAAVSSILLQAGFLLFKSAIPLIVPFYADPFLASLERAIFFGTDAWEVAHAITPAGLAAWFPLIYLTLWSALAFVFPVLVVATDFDDRRVTRYVWLFFLSWIVTGNLVALLGSSVGPVFYDRLLGTDRFVDLHAALADSGFAAGPIGMVQENLWTNLGGLLSCISAFPSVHVAVACIGALYVRERFRRFRLISDAFVALILLISVYSGYHYLLDGIASIVIVLALNAALVRHARRRVQDPVANGPLPKDRETPLKGAL